MKSEFSYLETPAELYRRSPKSCLFLYLGEEALEEKNGKLTRKLFHNVPYTKDELKEILLFKSYSEENGQILDCSDQHVLRYLYTGNFNYKECL